MTLVFIFFLVASLLTISIGNFFLTIFHKKKSDYNFSISEEGLIGIIFISLFGLILNFIFKLDQVITSLVFIFLLIFIFRIFKENNFIYIKKLIFHSLIISLIATIFIAFDNVNRPDAGIYHLPYIRMINEFKIIIGSANLNPLFGATSIFQYTSAMYNNIIFKDVGVTIPHALVGVYCFEYFVRNFFSKENNNDYFFKIFIFSVASYLLIEMNRYSDYGNDNPGHLYFFYLTSLFLNKNFSLDNQRNFKLFALISLFCFLNRPFLILSILMTFYLWISRKHYLTIFSFPFLSLFFFIFWITKNFLVSGCAIYPISFTCLDKLPWYSNEAKFRISARNSSEFSELHAKGWKDIINNVDYRNYEVKTELKQKFLKNFNWIDKNYISNHAYTFSKKIDYFVIYLFLVCLFIHIFKDNNKNFVLSLNDKRYFILSIISSIGVFILIYKFPLGRYGTFYLSIFVFCLIFPLFNYVVNKSSIKKINHILSIFLIILINIFLLKNLNRIVKNYSAQYNQAPWPRIYDNYFSIKNSNQKQNLPVNFKKINKNQILEVYYIDEGNFYTSQRKTLCLFNTAPCTQSSENFNTFEIKIEKGYYLINLNKD